MFGEELSPLEYDALKDCGYLERCLKETLRLRPPIMTMMRMCKTPQVGDAPHTVAVQGPLKSCITGV